MNELIIDEQNIQNKIYTIRNLQVMLDKDIAVLYGVKPIRLREQVKRNIDRFPEDFMFVLNDSEVDFMVSQNAIPSKQHLGGSSPLVFTEQGVSMLASVLKTDSAVNMSIKIIRAFVTMRKFIAQNTGIFQRLENIEMKLLKHDDHFSKIFEALESKEIQPSQGIFFEGQIYDAYAFVSDLIKRARQSIILLDNYIDDTVLTLFSKNPNITITIYTKTISKQLALDVQKYKAQYNNLTIKEFDLSHDRFLLIDNEVYHIGASLKDLGKKWFAFSKMDNASVAILEKLND
ncbi:MAG: ORF6N domain-containing protein [Burkholderiales bacterium]|jgi:hypothetical protein|nr:ORF6N domain-containing protein [Burkholderiales bacterium]